MAETIKLVNRKGEVKEVEIGSVEYFKTLMGV